MNRFDACHAVTARWEGGKVDHPSDPGGRTNRGVTQGRYDEYRRSVGRSRQDVFLMAPAEEGAIYRDGYWRAARCDELPPGFDLVTYDASVNSGQRRGVTWLQRGIGAAPDGRIGPATITDARHVALGRTSGVEAIQRIVAARTSFLRGLGTFKVFGRGWTNRCADVEARAVAMHLAVTGTSPGRIEQEAIKAEGKARTQTAGAGATAAGGGGAVAIPAEALPPAVTLLLLAVAVIAAVALLLKSRKNRARARAYAEVARELTPAADARPKRKA